MPRYVKRPLAGVVARADAPVVILEGAPGVGKTAMVKNEDAFRGFHYVTLADEETYKQVRRRPRMWASELPRPVVIDDVQRVESLVGTIRRLAPKKPTGRPEFVLVASRALPPAEVDAPLPARFTLFPLTQAELSGRKGCIVDDLFDGSVYRRFHSDQKRNELRTKMRIGGFPFRVMHPVSALSPECANRLPFREYLQAVSERSFGLHTSIEQLIEKAILEKVMFNPGLPLGVENVAHACGVDTATLITYLQEYEDRFFTHRLPQLDKQLPPKYPFGRSRVHLMDTALTVEALRVAGGDITMEMPVFAKVFRTFCVNQLVAAAQWAGERTECFHWKTFERRIREVDLVLKRGERLVGIAVRNSLSATSGTIGALRFLAKDERFERGFIIYMGSDVRQLSDKIWALPVSALWDKRAFFDGAVETTAARTAKGAATKVARAIADAAKAAAEETTVSTSDESGAPTLAELTTGARATITTTVTTSVTTSTTVQALVPDEF